MRCRPRRCHMLAHGIHDAPYAACRIDPCRAPLPLLGMRRHPMPYVAGQDLEIPHVRAGRGELDMALPLAADAAQSDLRAALLANHPAVLHPLVLAAEALPVGYRSEDGRAEQPGAFGLERPIVDGLGLGNLPEGPAPDLWGRTLCD